MLLLIVAIFLIYFLFKFRMRRRTVVQDVGCGLYACIVVTQCRIQPRRVTQQATAWCSGLELKEFLLASLFSMMTPVSIHTSTPMLHAFLEPSLSLEL